jgi:hippurate hydrolase
MTMRTVERMAPLQDEMIGIRRHLHTHPELGLEEYNTSKLVASLLEGWGYKVTKGLGQTGVVGTLSHGTGGKSIGLRADFDALPITEETGLPYASRTPGLMHACGHDGHTAMLLAAAKHLAETRGFDGTVHLIFQPAEENFGGAKLMIDDGLFERFPCDAVFGMHNMPDIEAGIFGFKEGTLFANAEGFDVVLRGVGGHASTPEVTRDPIVAGSAIVMALQTLVSRNLDPMESGVVTVGVFQAGRASNAIPQTATLTVDARAFTDEVAALFKRRIPEVIRLQADSFGVSASITEMTGYPLLMNDPSMTQYARKVAVDSVGQKNVIDLKRPYTGAEDFSYMLQKRPGSYLVLGAKTDTAQPLHHPGYDFNDAVLLTGAAYWADLTRDFLKSA